jgi:hypothetical protein
LIRLPVFSSQECFSVLRSDFECLEKAYGNYEVPAPIDEKTAIGNGWPLVQVVQPTAARAQVGALQDRSTLLGSFKFSVKPA